MASFKSLKIEKQYVLMFFIKDVAFVWKGALNTTRKLLPQIGIYRKKYNKIYLRNAWWSWLGFENQFRIVTPVDKVTDDKYYVYVWGATITDRTDFEKAVAAEILGLTRREIGYIQREREKRKK